jgi:hypothetical protein
MKRREFITLTGSAAAAWPLAARAQPASSPVVALLSSGRLPESLIGILRQGLAEQGFVEGRNVVIDYRHGDNQYERLAGLACRVRAPTGCRDRRVELASCTRRKGRDHDNSDCLHDP